MNETITKFLPMVATAIGLAIAQYLLKRGLAHVPSFPPRSLGDVPLFIKGFLTTPAIVGGLLLSACCTLMWLWIMKKFELSFAIPAFTAIYYVVIAVLSSVVLREQISMTRWGGIALMIAALALVSR